MSNVIRKAKPAEYTKIVSKPKSTSKSRDEAKRKKAEPAKEPAK